MKIVRCADVNADQSNPGYMLLVGKTLKELDAKYVKAGEPALLSPDRMTETVKTDLAQRMSEYSLAHPAHSIRLAVRHAYLATRAAVFGAPKVN